MFKGQPKGLFVLSLANMGERFRLLYHVSHFCIVHAGQRSASEPKQPARSSALFWQPSIFCRSSAACSPTRCWDMAKTIALGIVIMFFGYLLLAIPSGTGTTAIVTMCASLLLIAMGTGCFKGNLQALVGNLYDDPKYSAKRDLAFSIFYMCINIGAFFAPSAAEGVSNYFLGQRRLHLQRRNSRTDPPSGRWHHQSGGAENLRGFGRPTRSSGGRSGHLRTAIHRFVEHVVQLRLRGRLPLADRLDDYFPGLPPPVQIRR